MHKKLAATLAIAIFLLSTLAVMLPVQAHYTEGNTVNSYPYSVNNFDPHVAGVIGYVFPGGGEDAYLGSLPYGEAVSAATAAPGYIAPWSDKGTNPPGAPSQTWYQLAGNAYAPFGAILVNSTGDLIFAINATQNCNTADINEPAGSNPCVTIPGIAAPSTNRFYGSWGSWDILLPPEFGNILPEQVATTITNDYSAISVTTLDQSDRYAPGWTLVQILADGNNGNNGATGAASSWSTFINFTQRGEWYYARINGVKAPSIAGTYFFKMFLGGNGASGECGGVCSPDYWVPTQNWPVLLVKGEVDPAIVYGQIYYGGYNATLYNTPLTLPGEVWMQMTTKLDPYTGNKLTGYPLVNAWGFFNATAEGRYTVEGVAPGIYDIYASAAGYPRQLIATGVTVLKGQSLSLNGYLNPGPVLHGTVYTKHGFGEEPWPRTQYIKIELYNAPTVGFTVSSKAQLVSWSPLPCIAAGPAAIYASEANDGAGANALPTNGNPINDAYTCANYSPGANPNFNTPIGFQYAQLPSGGAWATVNTATTVTLGNGAASSPYTSISYPKSNALDVDEMGVGPPQSWVVLGGTTTPFQWQFGVKGEYGAPSQMDGHVPQMNATWVNGLTAGRYYARAWTTQYVQSEIDGATFHEVYFDVSAQEWAGDIAVPIDMRLTSWVNKTVYFHDTPGTLQTSYISTGAAVLTGGLYDAAGNLWAWNYTLLPGVSVEYPNGVRQWNITFYGFRYRWDGRDYGIPAGTYTPKVYAMGYRQQTFEQVSLSLSGQQVVISDHLYRGVGFNITIYSTDFEQPRVDRNWVWPTDWIDLAIYSGANNTGTPVYTRNRWSEQVYGQNTANCKNGHYASNCPTNVWFGYQSLATMPYTGGEIGGNTYDVFVASSVPAWNSPSSYDSGTYNFRAFTYGYVQDKTFTVSALKGEIADIKVNLVIGVNITVDILFKKENIITPTAMNMSARVRVFSDSGSLVGEWMTSQGDLVSTNGIVTNLVGTQVPGANRPTVGHGTPFPLNYVPAGTSEMRLLIAGLPVEDGQMRFGDPVFCQSANYFTCGYANYGIAGSPDYVGGYNIEVDYVPWYLPNAGPTRTYTATSGLGATTTGTYYPPVTGLLMGESFHTVPGNPANAFGYTEAGALSKAFLGHSMAPNHLGPYMQEGMWTLPNGHLSGGVSGEWEVDLRGYLAGTVVGFTWSGEFRTVSWASVSILGADNYTYKAYSWDGYYGFFTAPGSYKMTIAAPGYSPQSFSVAVSSGQSTVGGNVFLQQTNVPVPEFTGLAVVAFSALAASLYLLRRRHR